eukprot:4910560-Pyramimonas_sp.AAC.1
MVVQVAAQSPLPLVNQLRRLVQLSHIRRPLFRFPVAKRKSMCVGGYAYGEGSVLQNELVDVLKAAGFPAEHGKLF